MRNTKTKTETEPAAIKLGLPPNPSSVGEIIAYQRSQLCAELPSGDYKLTYMQQTDIGRLAVKAAYFDSGFKLSDKPDRWSISKLSSIARVANDYVKLVGLSDPSRYICGKTVALTLIEREFYDTAPSDTDRYQKIRDRIAAFKNRYPAD